MECIEIPECDFVFQLSTEQKHIKRNKYSPDKREDEYKKLRNKITKNNYRKTQGIKNLLIKLKTFIDEKIVTRDVIFEFLNKIDLKE
jgi:hypothetical protein